ncbi:MAG: hypothetical protein VKN72_23400 [Nostocales cyanobacterium 94392]|nr:hypothetical protein [Nostocales cyanobacterium 94392]
MKFSQNGSKVFPISIPYFRNSDNLELTKIHHSSQTIVDLHNFEV